MNGRLDAISVEELETLLRRIEASDIATTLRFGRLSDPIFAGWFGDRLMCLVGFAPRTMLSAEAYLWLITTHDTLRHPLVLARWGKRLVGMALTRYPVLFGHCTQGSEHWLTSLGAILGPEDSGYATFTIRA